MLGETVFRSEELPAGDRLAALDDLWVADAHPMRVVSEHPERFRATLRAVDLGAVNAVRLEVSPSEVLRTPALVRRSDPELCGVVVPLSGTVGVVQAGRGMVLGAGELALYDSSRPFRIRLSAPGGAADGAVCLVRAHLPRALLRLPADGLRRLTVGPLPASAGYAGLLAGLLADVTSSTTAFRPRDLPRLAGLAQELLAATVAHHLDRDGTAPGDAEPGARLARIEEYVRRHLGDPGLSPETVAAAHHLSTGHLHRLFRARETTVAAWIRRERLERARRDLADPDLRHLPIHRVATRWGFKDHPTFTRAFRTAYGASPSEYRGADGAPMARIVKNRATARQ